MVVLGLDVQWMNLTMHPGLDSAWKIIEQISIWEFHFLLGKRALSSLEVVVGELNGKGTSLIPPLVSNFLPVPLIDDHS